MNRSLIALIGCVALAGCITASQTAEKVDTTALGLYATIGNNLDVWEGHACPVGPGAVVTPDCDPTSPTAKWGKPEALRRQAWTALTNGNAAYHSGIISDLTTLESLVTQSKAPS